MTPQYDNQLMSSFTLWLDNKICSVGSGYYDTLIQFWPNKQVYNGLLSYSSPYIQIVSDSSLPGVSVPTGIYINSSFIGVGQSGLSGIDYNNGRFYCSGNFSGNIYITGSVKEIPVKMTSDPETKILFETKYETKPRTTNPSTGLNTDAVPYPVIFIRNSATKNEPWEFGGTENTINYIRAIALCDSQFQLDAVLGILRDRTRDYVPLLTQSEFPYNSLGYIKNYPYNYSTLTANKVLNGQAAFVEDVFIAKFDQNAFGESVKDLNPNVYVGIIDFEVSKPRNV